MNEVTTTQTTARIYRRFSDPFNFFGLELPPWVWGLILGVVLAVAFFYVAWMYRKDSRSVGIWWASFLGLLRSGVYVMLAIIFLLPAKQLREEIRDQSKVLVLWDSSLSLVETRDDLPEEGKKFSDMLTRQDKVLAFLQNKNLGFLKELMDKNPVTMHRFGSRLDESFYTYSDGQVVSWKDLEAKKENEKKDEESTPKPSARLGVTSALLTTYLKPNRIDQNLSDRINQLEAGIDQVNGALRLDEPTLALLREYADQGRESDPARKGDKQAGEEHEWNVGVIAALGGGLLVALVACFLLRRPLGAPGTAALAMLALVAVGVLGWYYAYPLRPVEEEIAGEPKTAVTRDFRNGMVLSNEEKQDIKSRIKQDKERIKNLLAHNVKVVDAGVFNSTNVTDTTLNLVNKEINKMVQGIIVVTDGRNTTASTIQALEQLEKRARDHKIPIFVVGVGTERAHVRIDFADLRAPKTIRPEDQFKAQVELIGEGKPEQQVDVTLEVTCPNKKQDGKEDFEDIRIQEFDPKAPKDSKKIEISLGKRVILMPNEPVKFDKSALPRATAEFQIDAAALARAAGVDLNSEMYRGKKWEIVETTGGEGRAGTEIRLVAKVPRDRAEIFPEAEHVSQKVGVQVLRRPLQVLLFASSASREFQFLRTLLIREMDHERVLLSIYVQPPPGSTEQKEGIVHGIPPKRQLTAFPDKFDEVADDDDAKLMDLANYDVMVCFDPDWTQLTEKQLGNVLKWVDRGAGLVAIGGPINTLQLARPGAYKEKLKPILDLYPVVLKDIRIDDLDRKPDKPWPLIFSGATPEMEFLRLSDEVERGAAPFLSDWTDFWVGRTKENPGKAGIEHGMYNYYPVEQEKAGNIVVARFSDPLAKDKVGQQMPFMVLSPEGTGRRVIWLGSGELWRLRQYKEMFHERFWTKLLRYAGSGTQGAGAKRVTLYVGGPYKANQVIKVDGKISGKGGMPLNPKSKLPQVTIKPPAGVNPRDVPSGLEMKPRPASDYSETVFQIRSPGTYELEVMVPETKDVATARFVVTPANPELDNTRPDFGLMYRLASDADQVMARIRDNGIRQQLKQSLSKPQGTDLRPAGKGNAAQESGEDKMRLYFDLGNANLIPSCMITDINISNSNGAVTDEWDDGMTVYDPGPPGQPIKLSYMLLLGVGLLSAEWLTRKLLRLA